MEANAAILKEIETIIKRLKKDYKLTQRDIEKGISLSEDYLSDAISKGGNKTLLKKLKKYQIELDERAKNPAFEVLDIVREMQVKMDIMFSEMVVIIADRKKQTITETMHQFQKMVEEKINKKK